MRALLWVALLAGALALQGCTALAAGTAADLNRQRRVAATVRPEALSDSSFAPGDTLRVRLASGDEIRGAFVALSQDSLALEERAFARADLDRVERPWVRADLGGNLLIGFLADAAVLYFIMSSFTLNLSNSRL